MPTPVSRTRQPKFITFPLHWRSPHPEQTVPTAVRLRFRQEPCSLLHLRLLCSLCWGLYASGVLHSPRAAQKARVTTLTDRFLKTKLPTRRLPSVTVGSAHLYLEIWFVWLETPAVRSLAELENTWGERLMHRMLEPGWMQRAVCAFNLTWEISSDTYLPLVELSPGKRLTIILQTEDKNCDHAAPQSWGLPWDKQAGALSLHWAGRLRHIPEEPAPGRGGRGAELGPSDTLSTPRGSQPRAQLRTALPWSARPVWIRTSRKSVLQ